mgnify:CR=1 FL=1
MLLDYIERLINGILSPVWDELAQLRLRVTFLEEEVKKLNAGLQNEGAVDKKDDQ